MALEISPPEWEYKLRTYSLSICDDSVSFRNYQANESLKKGLSN